MSTGCNNRIFSLTIFTRTQLQQKAAGCFQASRVAKADDKKKMNVSKLCFGSRMLNITMFVHIYTSWAPTIVISGVLTTTTKTAENKMGFTGVHKL